MEALKPRVSFADLQRMPDDGNRYELYDGELRVVPSPLPIHEIVKRRLLELLIRHAATTGEEAFDAPFDIVLSEHDVVQPALLYLPEYWIVDPDSRTIEAWVLKDDQYTERVVWRTGRREAFTQPGLVIDIEHVFDGLD